jgi:hypothetical protein
MRGATCRRRSPPPCAEYYRLRANTYSGGTVVMQTDRVRRARGELLAD